MTEQQNTTESKKDNLTSKIKTLFEEGLSVDEIQIKLNEIGIIKDKHFIRNIVYRIRLKKGLINSSSDSNNKNYSSTIMIKVFEDETDNNNLKLFVKTNKEFEDYLKANKEKRDTSNLFGRATEGKFYHLRLDNDSCLDDINSSIFVGYRKIGINRAVLRCVGISEGLTFNLSDYGLMTEDNLRIAIKKLTRIYADFYKKFILNQRINIESEVLLEQ